VRESKAGASIAGADMALLAIAGEGRNGASTGDWEHSSVFVSDIEEKYYNPHS
jgi:hypothetical protein